MKTLCVFFLLILSLGSYWQMRKVAREKERQAAEAAHVEHADLDPAGPAHSGNWVASRSSSGVVRVRELQPGISYQQSVGGGGYNGPIPPTPKPRTMLDRPANR